MGPAEVIQAPQGNRSISLGPAGEILIPTVQIPVFQEMRMLGITVRQSPTAPRRRAVKTLEAHRSRVRPPGFELPNRFLSGFPGRWLGRPMDAPGYVLDQARLRPHEASCLALGSSTLSLPEKDVRQKIGI